MKEKSKSESEIKYAVNKAQSQSDRRALSSLAWQVPLPCHTSVPHARCSQGNNMGYGMPFIPSLRAREW